MNRLKSTVLCTFLLTRKKMVQLFILEFLSTFFMIAKVYKLKSDSASYSGYYSGNAVYIILFMFIFGLSFYERHTAFCTANAVSRKYRAVSAAVCAGSICVVTALYDFIIRLALVPFRSVSEAELIRLTVHSVFFDGTPVVLAALESVLLYILVFSAGYFCGGISFAKSPKFMLGTVSLVTAVLALSFVIGKFTWINPVGWLMILPSLMFRSVLTACLLYAALSAALLYFGYRLSLVQKHGFIEERGA